MDCHDDDLDVDVDVDMVDPTGGKIDGFFGDACKRFATYETVVQTAFCKSMVSEFGVDEAADEATAAAFVYARAMYQYLSPEEIRVAQEADRAQGICSHGLDKMTCPCGCFEFD